MVRISPSVIIPAYNEERRIPLTLEKLSSYLKERFGKYEIVVIDDGSTDRTSSVVDAMGKRLGNIRLIQYEMNKGKGFAVRKGVMASMGDLILMTDADLSTPIEEIEKLLPFIEKGFDIIIGSRGLRGSEIAVRQAWYRERMGKTFNLLVCLLLMDGLKDTQCGFKLFRSEAARDLFPKSLINGFGFDVEILFLAKKAGYLIKEVPIRWFNSPVSRVKLITDSFMMFFDLLRIRANWMIGKYNDNCRHRH